MSRHPPDMTVKNQLKVGRRDSNALPRIQSMPPNYRLADFVGEEAASRKTRASTTDQAPPFENKLAKAEKAPMNTTFTVVKGTTPLTALAQCQQEPMPKLAERSTSLDTILKKMNICLVEEEEKRESVSLPRELSRHSTGSSGRRSGKSLRDRPWSDKLPRLNEQQKSGPGRLSLTNPINAQSHFELHKYKETLANY